MARISNKLFHIAPKFQLSAVIIKHPYTFCFCYKIVMKGEGAFIREEAFITKALVYVMISIQLQM